MLRWYYSVDASTVTEITSRVRIPLPDGDATPVGVGAHAWEGSGWSGTIEVDDPDGDLLMLVHRRIYCDASLEGSGTQRVGNWFIQDLDVVRMDPWDATARRWIVLMADENSLLSRRVFVGSDTDRPEETDIARIRWLLTTTEANTLDPDETFIDTANPVTLDATSYLHQRPDDVLRDANQRSHKNYWVKYGEPAAVGGAIVSSSVAAASVITTTTAHGLTSGMSVVIAGHSGSTPSINGTHVVTVTGAATYTIPVTVTVGGTGGTTTTIGRYQLCYFNANTSDLYQSAIDLSNVASDISGGSFPYADDTRLNRQGGRMASGVVVTYPGGYEYEQDTSTGDAYVYRDVIAPNPNVRSSAQATARAIAHLADLAEPDDEIETEFEATEAQVNDAMHGMLLPFRASHFPNYTSGSDRPGYSVGTNTRIVRREVRQKSNARFGVHLWLSPVRGIACVANESLVQFYDEEKLPVMASSQTFDVPAPDQTPGVIVALLNVEAPFISVGPAVDIDTSGDWEHLDEWEVALGEYWHQVTDTAYLPYTSGTPEALVGDLTFVEATAWSTSWTAVAVSVATADTSPVQHATSSGPTSGNVTLPSPPTEGNILLMFETVRDGDETTPPDGWTLISDVTHGQGSGAPGGVSHIYVYGNCVTAGMSSTITVQPLDLTTERHSFVSEWTPGAIS